MTAGDAGLISSEEQFQRLIDLFKGMGPIGEPFLELARMTRAEGIQLVLAGPSASIDPQQIDITPNRTIIFITAPFPFSEMQNIAGWLFVWTRQLHLVSVMPPPVETFRKAVLAARTTGHVLLVQTDASLMHEWSRAFHHVPREITIEPGKEAVAPKDALLH